MSKWLLALCLALLPGLADAVGLGRLSVLSALGQPFVAEIELTASKAELGSLSAQLSNSDAYRDANLQFNSALVGARLALERRPGGRPYLKITTTRPVNEPFLDLLVEVSWAAGRLTREYTALLDPPGVPPAPPAPEISAVPEARPAPAPSAVVSAPAPAPAPEVSRPIAAAPMAGAKEYGPIQRGETLGKIAESVMPEGVTLEQMLVALYRSNQDAFIRKNLNLVRAGKILRVPDRDEVLAVSRGEAVKVYRAHVTDWNAYRQKLAESAGTVKAEGRTAVSGKITTKVEDRASGSAPKDVVRLSKGEPPGAAAGKGKPASAAERIRMLEEEVVAREKALNEANERIAQLETTVKDLRKLVELKSPGMAAAQQQAAAPKGAAKPEPAKPEAIAAAKPEPATAAPAKPEPAVAPAPMPAPPAKPAPKATPKPKPKPVAAPKEPELMDQVLDALTDPLYLGAGGGVLVIGGLAFWMARRRRARAEAGDEMPVAPTLGAAADVSAEAGAPEGDEAAAPATDEVDPLAEAEVYIAYGRDGQAEEILKEALNQNPAREDVQLKLLEIYSARKDKSAFGKVAGDLRRLTGGVGPNWMKVAAMGYALDPSNAMFEAGKGAESPAAQAAASTDIDLDLGLDETTASGTDITLEAGAAEAATGAATEILDLGAVETGGEQAAGAPDLLLELPDTGAAPAAAPAARAAPAAAPAQESNVIDFQIELPKVEPEEPTQAAQAPTASGGGDGGLDFKLDGLDLDTGGETKPAAAGGEKDGHWYDVQTKFDLAKAYQEMGDKDGAKEILQEVIKEGDAEQQTQAKALLDSLG